MDEEASVYLREIQSKPEISLGEKANARQPGIRCCSREPDLSVCDPPSPRLNPSPAPPQVSAPEAHISGNAAVIYSRELQDDVHQARFSYKSISSRHFSKEVYVLVRPLCHHLPPLYHLFV